MSETSVIGEDSDEDKVVFLDYESTCTEKHSTVKVKTPRRERPNKFQSLFQQKRYKDDLENEKYASDTFEIEELMRVSKVRKVEAKHLQSLSNDYGYNDHDTSLMSQFHAAIESSPGAYLHEEALSKAAVNSSSSSSYGQIPADLPPSHRKRTATASPVGHQSLDIADDRPAHWNRRRSIPNRAQASTSAVKATASMIKSAGVASKPHKVIQIPKPKALPAVVSAPVSADRLASGGLSFRPSWMTSSTAPARTPATTTTSTATAAAAVVAELTEEIQEDISSPTRPSLPVRNIGASSMDNSNSQRLSLSSPQSAYPQRSLTMQPQHTSFLSPERSHTFHDIDSAERAPRAGNYRGTSSRTTAKARPGSLKAKLQKLLRDADAAENRIVNIPADKQSRAVDLQDPRHRADCYVEAQLRGMQSDRAPFKVVLGEVVGMWSKEGAPLALTKQNGHALVDDLCTATTTITAAGREGEGGDTVSVSGNRQGGGELQLGAELLIYLKPETCVGADRSLCEGVRLRVYDPVFLQLPVTVRTGGSTSSTNSSRGRRYAVQSAELIWMMINTGCWEPILEEQE